MKSTRLCLALVGAALAVIVLFSIRNVKRGGAIFRGQSVAAPPKVPAIVRSLRPNYPYSVIPGGIYSADELRRRIERDSLVRGHYSGFNTQAARLILATSDSFEYASYRM